MHVTVRLFAGLRERAGSGELALELPDGASVSDVLAHDRVRAVTADTDVVMAVNREYAEADRTLRAGDELALIPPVSGGAELEYPIHVAVTDRPLSLDRLTAFVRDPRAGAIVTFTGVTRGVDHLDYEAYVEMARDELRRILAEAVAAHRLCRAAAEHRTGRVDLSEPSVIVAASAPHRPEAFAGARAMIDQIKRRVPVFKRERGEWVQDWLPRTEPHGSDPDR